MAKFQPRARALDLLGRQQIAGIPTALNELFKNAHDAYADNVEVDFLRKYNLLLLRDNGIGMTQEDFESRWLTLGTESKLETTSGISKPYKDKNKETRPTMGEKGIGRLAIAAIGPQVLVITRARREDGLHPFVVSLINWSMFELPGINLEEIEIPVTTFQSLNEITAPHVGELVQDLKNTLSSVAGKTDKSLCDRIRAELDQFTFNERVINLNDHLSLDNGGTFFIIQPTYSQILVDIDGDSREKGDLAPPLHTTLCGFTNTAIKQDVPIKTAFRDHRQDGSTEDLIGEKNFFTPEDYKKVDHHISGHFDEYGNFKGRLSIYQMEADEIEFIFNTTGKKSACGPFDIDFGYIQGNRKDSLLDEEEFTRITQKCNRMGGLFVYRDNIRILPFGRHDFDYFGIERKRTFSASKAFFSHRRIIGAISLTRKENASLSEKAGREGFINNSASADFRITVEQFLDALAQKYFSESSELADKWSQTKQTLNKNHLLLDKRKKSLKGKKDLFLKDLADAIAKLDDRNGRSQAVQKIIQIVQSVDTSLTKITDTDDLDHYASTIINLESSAHQSILEIETNLTVVKPKKIGFNKKQESDWAKYQILKDDILLPAIKKAQAELNVLISEKAKTAKLHLDSKRRLEQSISLFKQSRLKDIKKEETSVFSSHKQVDEYVRSTRKEHKILLDQLELKLDKALHDINKNDDLNNFTEIRSELESTVNQTASAISEKYTRIQYALENVLQTKGEDEDDATIIQALEGRVEALEEELEENLESVQLGMAIKIVNHEFEANIQGVRNSIKALKKWSDANKNLQGLYDQLRDGFDHLDNYLNLFTPLERRMRRRKTQITGKSVHDFIMKLYEERLERHNVSLKATNAFLQHNIETFASVIYPVFINLIDNSIYWLSVSNAVEKTILLDATEQGFVVADNGPGISQIDRPHIYDFGYTRKVHGGGGMGLYIAKTVLKHEGFDIELTSKESVKGTEFLIYTEENEQK
ncbi:MAG: ATPase [Magnetococcales bacterium]|nr:ATPase [Magnetococcales bacterium]MAF32344.1 ATPase [Magnetococcales bacterium]|tara:strand:+ start:75620 stop:78586 length:2967 start_codon:yes stop_codon:yes gene_type:complete